MRHARCHGAGFHTHYTIAEILDSTISSNEGVGFFGDVSVAGSTISGNALGASSAVTLFRVPGSRRPELKECLRRPEASEETSQEVQSFFQRMRSDGLGEFAKLGL